MKVKPVNVNHLPPPILPATLSQKGNRDFLTLDDVNVTHKTVLLRGDLNVPIATDGTVADTTRLSRLAVTIRELQEKQSKIVILSHFGRPVPGKPDPVFSLRPIVPALANILGCPIGFCETLVGAASKARIADMQWAEVLVLENTRFALGEESNAPGLARQLAELGDVFVNDAFSTAHRAHASTAGVAQWLPAIAGREMQSELDALTLALGKPQRPLLAMVGGSKISTKLDLLANLTAKVDTLVLGGGMANTFLAAQGKAMAASLVEYDMLETARSIWAQSAAKGCTIILPLDVVVAAKPTPNTATQTVTVDAIPAGMMALDVGPQSIAAIIAAISHSKTLVWNGPLGMFEIPPFACGTKAVAAFIGAQVQAKKLIAVAGGGDTASAVHMAGVADQITYLSSAGGAFLEWLEGRVLAGVEALRLAAGRAESVTPSVKGIK